MSLSIKSDFWGDFAKEQSEKKARKQKTLGELARFTAETKTHTPAFDKYLQQNLK